jgi:hypothetical protein
MWVMMWRIWLDVKTGPGRSAGRPISGNVVTDFISELLTLFPSYRLYSHGTFAGPSLNSEMTFYQLQPGPPFFIHFVTNAEPFVV